jgi:hypothetical protein
MPRTYSVSFTAVAVTAAQDLIAIYGAAGKMCKIRRISVNIAASTLPAVVGLEIRCRFLPATVTAGSSGTAPTPQKLDNGDAAATFTARVNDTTPATTSGTAAVLESNGAHVYAGYDYQFPIPPKVGPSQAFVFELLNTVTATLSGTVIVDEEG